MKRVSWLVVGVVLLGSLAVMSFAVSAHAEQGMGYAFRPPA